MKILVAAILYFIVALFLSLTEGKKEDQFNFETTSDWKKRVFGPKDWSQVTCDDLGTCVSALTTDWMICHVILRPLFVLIINAYRFTAWLADSLASFDTLHP